MFERALEYLVGELVAGPGPTGGQVPHVLQDGVVAQTRLLGQLVLNN